MHATASRAVPMARAVSESAFVMRDTLATDVKHSIDVRTFSVLFTVDAVTESAFVTMVSMVTHVMY